MGECPVKIFIEETKEFNQYFKRYNYHRNEDVSIYIGILLSIIRAASFQEI